MEADLNSIAQRLIDAESLSELKMIKKTHGEPETRQAYNLLSPDEQERIEKLCAAGKAIAVGDELIFRRILDGLISKGKVVKIKKHVAILHTGEVIPLDDHIPEVRRVNTDFDGVAIK